MKRFLVLLAVCALCALPFVPQAAAHAAGAGYAVADGYNIWLYGSPDEDDRLFVLPCSYYVRVLDGGETFSYVEYGPDRSPYRPVRGYCRTAELTPVDFVPARPYLEYVFDLRLGYGVEDKGGFASDFLTETRQAAYYGHCYKSGQLYYYVLCGDAFGLVPAERELEYEHNTDYLEAVSAGGDAQESAESGLSAGEIAAICVACAGAVAVALLVARGKRSSPHAAGDCERAEF